MVYASFGERLCALMTERGIGVRVLARQVPCNPGYLSHLRAGHSQPSPELARRLDDLLGAGGELAAMVRPRKRASNGLPPAPPATVPPGALAGAPFAPEITVTIGGVLHGRARPVRVTPIDLDALRHQTVRAWELRQSTQYAALGELLAGLLAETEDATSHARSEQDRLTLASVAVHAYNAASSLLKRLEASELAAVAADRAYQAAREVGDQVLIGAATLRLANVYLSAGRYHEALDAAVRGADTLAANMGATPAISATYGALLLTAALAAAQLGEGPQAWELLGQAKVASVLLGREYAGLHAVFGPVNVAIHGVQVATELGNPREALRRAEHVDVDQLPPALLERRSTLLVDVARNHQRRGDQHLALNILLDAERLAPQEVHYNRVAHRLVGELLRTARGPALEVRELAQRMGVAA